MNHSPGKIAIRILILLGIFAAAMGILEAVVVVYLRLIYYPQGFAFPLSILPPEMLSVEVHREITTIIMLVIAGIISGRNSLEKFALFLYTFGSWDIFYYIGLKLYLDWPHSLLTWDVLFLIPVIWAGPVLAPIIVSLTMIFLAFCMIYLQARGYTVNIALREWGLMATGALIIFWTFIRDYSLIVIKEGVLSGAWRLAADKHFLEIISKYKPVNYHWDIFALGEILIISAVVLIMRRAKKRGLLSGY